MTKTQYEQKQTPLYKRRHRMVLSAGGWHNLKLHHWFNRRIFPEITIRPGLSKKNLWGLITKDFLQAAFPPNKQHS